MGLPPVVLNSNPAPWSTNPPPCTSSGCQNFFPTIDPIVGPGDITHFGSQFEQTLKLSSDDSDTDGDGQCDELDLDDDNDGVDDITEELGLDGVADTGDETDRLNPDECGDSDNDQCDDCAVGTDDFGPLADNDSSNDGRVS